MGTDRVFAAELQALRPQVGPGALGRQPDAGARRLRGDGEPPRGPLPPRAGRLLAALLAAGARRRARHRGARRDGRRARARQRRSTTRSCWSRTTGRRAGRVESNGNFHGAPVAYVLDFLAIVAADVASISERRSDRFLDRARNHDLPPFLADDPGRRQRPDDRAVHPGRDRLRAQAPGGAGQRRLDPVERDAGGPRVDGLVAPPASCGGPSTG